MQKYNRKVRESSRKFVFFPLKGAPMLQRFESSHFTKRYNLNIYIYINIYTVEKNELSNFSALALSFS